MPQKKTPIDDPKLVAAVSKLSTDERKIYDAILRSFPATEPWSAYDHAINGGVRFQFIPK
jgi:hypothetical protein